MAFVYKGTGAAVTYQSELAKAGPDASAAHQRQVDTYKLALAGSRDCRRLWRDFEAECPALARLVVADVQAERREGAEVSRRLDERLVRAEELVVKGAGVTVVKSAERDVLKAANEVLRLAEQESCNPELRVWAEMAARAG